MARFDRGMTAEERAIRGNIMSHLMSNNMPRYARLLALFDLQILPPNIMDNGEWIAFMRPEKGIIAINRDVIEDPNNSMEIISLLIRHEILHEWRDHYKRTIEQLAKESGIDLTSLPEEEQEKKIKELEQVMFSDDLFNVAADLEISNVGYDDYDKILVHKISLAGEIKQGLVTEEQPRWKNWVNLPMEDMYTNLRDLRLITVKGQLLGDSVFLAPSTNTFYLPEDSLNPRIQKSIADTITNYFSSKMNSLLDSTEK